MSSQFMLSSIFALGSLVEVICLISKPQIDKNGRFSGSFSFCLKLLNERKLCLSIFMDRLFVFSRSETFEKFIIHCFQYFFDAFARKKEVIVI